MKVRFSEILPKLLRAFQRFPLVILLFFLATALSLWLLRLESEDRALYVDRLYFWLQPIYLLAIFHLGTCLMEEGQAFTRLRAFFVAIFTLILGGLFYFYLQEFAAFNQKGLWTQFVVLSIAAHLWVAAAPFLLRSSVEAFWQYNRRLFFRFLLAALYSSVLYSGLALAFLAVENLFGASYYRNFYADLFFLIAGIFNTLFFLAGLPELKKTDALPGNHPKALRYFLQYLLWPLVAIYYLILGAYSLKLMLDWSLPLAWIGLMVSGISVLGLFAFLLWYPYRQKTGFFILKKIEYFYFSAMLMPLVLLALSLIKRIKVYGWTPPRYYLALGGVWLLFLSLYFLISRSKNIRWVPISLCFLLLLSFFGPWGAYETSLRSQTARLESLLIKNQLWNKRKLVPSSKKISSEDQFEISNITEYLVDTHGVQVLNLWASKEILSGSSFNSNQEALKGPSTYSRDLQVRKNFLEYLKVDKKYDSDFITCTTKDLYRYNRPQIFRVKGYDYVVSIKRYYDPKKNKIKLDDEGSIVLQSGDQKEAWEVKKAEQTLLKFNLEKELAEYLEKASVDCQMEKPLVLEFSNEKIILKIELDRFTFWQRPQKLYDMDARLFYRLL